LSTKLVATATSLEGSKKNNFSSVICGQSSTSPADFVKIGPLDVEMTGPTKTTKIQFKKIEQQHSSGCRANNVTSQCHSVGGCCAGLR